ncbi:MAG: hypothetical protein ACFHXK_13160 [bacterium]
MKILLFAGLLVVLLLAVAYMRRLRQPAARSSPGKPQNLMDPQFARKVLGLGEGPLSADEVIAAHRRLMQRVHPDKGGSELLAQQLNEAKRVLLQHLS